MRARAELADAFFRAGQIENAITEFVGILKLNPNDNQALRYQLLGCYMTLGQLSEARDLFAAYPDEERYNTVFAWAKVLDFYLSGEEEHAVQAISAARKQNPSSLDYVLGHRKTPRQLPPSYSPGSVEEAICFAGPLQAPWESHPTAKKWLSNMFPKKKK